MATTTISSDDDGSIYVNNLKKAVKSIEQGYKVRVLDKNGQDLALFGGTSDIQEVKRLLMQHDGSYPLAGPNFR